MAIPAHETEYFIIENSNLQKKANTAKFNPITYDPVHHTYRKIGDVVGKAFNDGLKLK